MITAQTPTARQQLFDRYWQTRECVSADARTRQRTKYCTRLMKRKSGRLLDVGCGRGYTSAFFAARDFEVLGIDISPKSVAWTREQGVEARVIDLDKDILPGPFDTIICLETLQYLNDPKKALAKLKNALAEGGEIILSLPCENHLLGRLLKMRAAPPEGTYAQTTFRPLLHRRLITAADLEIATSLPISLVPPRWKFLLGPGRFLARLMPTLCAISVMYRLVVGEKQ